MSGYKQERSITALLMLVGAVCLGNAVQLGNGTIFNSPDKTLFFNSSIGWMTAALMCSLLAVVLPKINWLETVANRHFGLLAGFGIGWEFYRQIITSPGAFVDVTVFRAFLPFILLMTVCALVAMSAVGGRSPLGVFAGPLLVIAFAMAGIWLVSVDSRPQIDVHIMHHDSTTALMRGENPYRLTFPNIYKEDPATLYGHEVANRERLLVGFAYPPLSLLISTVGQAIWDYRAANVMALAIAAGLMLMARPGSRAIAAAAVLLLTPRIFFVIELGWTEPLVVMMFVLLATTACRWPKITPWTLGLFLAIKQYAVLTLPALWLIRPDRRKYLGALLIGFGLALAITLPFFLWDPSAFTRSAILMQFRQPLRADALSYLALVKRDYGIELPSLIGFAAAGVGAFIGLLCCPRTAGGFAAAVALEMMMFFAFNKQAFCNYYFLVIGIMCCCSAMTASAEQTVPVSTVHEGQDLRPRGRAVLEDAAEGAGYHG